MDVIHLTTREAIIYATLINAGIGLVLGLIPLLFGFFNNRLKIGAIGFATAILGGAVLGIFLSIPATIIFTWLVVRKSKLAEVPAINVRVVNEEPIGVSVESSEVDRRNQ